MFSHVIVVLLIYSAFILAQPSDLGFSVGSQFYNLEL